MSGVTFDPSQTAETTVQTVYHGNLLQRMANMVDSLSKTFTALSKNERKAGREIEREYLLWTGKGGDASKSQGWRSLAGTIMESGLFLLSFGCPTRNGQAAMQSLSKIGSSVGSFLGVSFQNDASRCHATATIKQQKMQENASRAQSDGSAPKQAIDGAFQSLFQYWSKSTTSN